MGDADFENSTNIRKGRKNEISDLRITTAFFLCLLASGILVVSFLPPAFSNDDKGDANFVSPYKGCKISGTSENFQTKKLIFMVIDAWRLDFLTTEISTMKFLRNSLSSGRAIAFDTFARTPTVTMPRITALLSGTLPSFGSVLTNFASPEMTVDNWVKQAQEKGKRINFYGDDTWLRLFPTVFRNAEGVTSFYVNDYTEVDNNVTRHLADLLHTSKSRDSWDVLILHYLGLDHIGHSLGGTSSEISVKLREMDEIIERIYMALRNESTLMVIVGDHGMTPQGGHGGASLEESRVPMVFLHTNAQLISTPKNFEFPKAEQLDLASTLSFFLDLPNPRHSAGLSLLPEIAKTWKFERLELAEEIYKSHYQLDRLSNENHILDLIREKFFTAAPEICDDMTKELIEWYHREGEKIFRSSQNSILEQQNRFSAGSCLISMLLVGMAYALLVGNLGIMSIRKISESIHLLILTIFITHSSSLVEEEHEIWYFLATTALLAHTLLHKKWRHCLTAMFLHRIAIGYTMDMRRRWRMDKEVLPPPAFEDPSFVAEFAEQFENFNVKIFIGSLPWPLTAALIFGSILGIVINEPRSCKSRLASLTFVLLLACRVHRLFEKTLPLSMFTLDLPSTLFRLACFWLLRSRPSSALIAYLLFLTPNHLLPLYFVVYKMGRTVGRLELGEELAYLIWASFFYAGASNSISSIDISPGYTGLLTYSPLTVGAQIWTNAYGPVFIFLIGYSRESRLTRNEVIIVSRYRLLMLLLSIASFVLFREHLFVWSVFGPKVVFEILHTLTLIFVLLIIRVFN